MAAYKEPFFVDNIKVVLTDILGTYVYHSDAGKREKIVKYLGDEGFFDKPEENGKPVLKQ